MEKGTLRLDLSHFYIPGLLPVGKSYPMTEAAGAFLLGVKEGIERLIRDADSATCSSDCHNDLVQHSTAHASPNWPANHS